MEFNHYSVLLQECIDALNIDPNGIYVDGTAGGAGRSREIAKRLTTGRLISIDKDPDAIAVATERLAPYPCAQVVQGDFADMDQILANLRIDQVNGILLDLGVSSHQLDRGERGFSYNVDAPLDMRMSQSGLSARDIVNTYSVDELTRILREYGEERFAYKIARNIEKRRAQAPIETTFELVEIVKESIPGCGPPGGRTSGQAHLPGHPHRSQQRAGSPVPVPGPCIRIPGTGRTLCHHHFPLAGGPDGQAEVCRSGQGLYLPAGFPGLRLRPYTARQTGQPQAHSPLGGGAGEKQPKPQRQAAGV